MERWSSEKHRPNSGWSWPFLWEPSPCSSVHSSRDAKYEKTIGHSNKTSKITTTQENELITVNQHVYIYIYYIYIMYIHINTYNLKDPKDKLLCVVRQFLPPALSTLPSGFVEGNKINSETKKRKRDYTNWDAVGTVDNGAHILKPKQCKGSTQEDHF